MVEWNQQISVKRSFLVKNKVLIDIALKLNNNYNHMHIQRNILLAA
jgi:hypothetical protein